MLSTGLHFASEITYFGHYAISIMYRGTMAEKRKLAAILAADVVGLAD